MARWRGPVFFVKMIIFFSLCAAAPTAPGSSASHTVKCLPSDVAALRAIARSFPASSFPDWLQKASAGDESCCEWANVTCSSAEGGGDERRRVTELVLNSRNLQNYGIPDAICALSALTELSIRAGDLSGPIPDCIGDNLTNLVLLDLSINSLTGPIPNSFSRLQSLQSLGLRGSGKLSGAFPIFLTTATHLTFLDLSFNSFSGPIPFFNTSSSPSALTYVDLSGNAFSGSVASNFFGPRSHFPFLTDLILSSNSLSGDIPTFDSSHFPLLQSLEVSNNLFSGSLPKSLCGLANLITLDVSSNAFSGSFLHCSSPTALSQHLQYLDASNNQFTGALPEWIGSSLTSLITLSFSHNSFNGSLPDSWRNLDSLLELKLDGISLLPRTQGSTKLPLWLWASQVDSLSLSSMGLQDADLLGFNSSTACSSMFGLATSELQLSFNNLTVDFLHSISNCTALASLNLSGNPLHLNLDNPEVVNLLPQSLISALDLSSCELRGHLSSMFFNHINGAAAGLYSLYLARNHLVGQISGLGSVSTIAFLDLSNNSLTGVAPLDPKLNFVQSLSLSSNNLTGDLSSLLGNIFDFGNCNGLDTLDVSYNFLSGPIPSLFGQCLSLARRLKLNNNGLEGPIPSELFENTQASLKLEILSLSSNKVTGEIPASIRNLRNLVLLDLSHNRLQGTLASLTNLTHSTWLFMQMRVLLLSHNNFTGSVPDELGHVAPALQLIDLSNNHLSGPIPIETLQDLPAFRNPAKMAGIPMLNILKGTLYEEVDVDMKGKAELYHYVLEALTVLDLSGNRFNGSIATGLGELKGLVSLNLSRNSLSGPLPADMGLLGQQLQSLDLSFNGFVGPIPPDFKNLTALAVFNVSYNRGLVGQIPLNQPQFERSDSYVGDPGLCGDPILPPCGRAPPPTTSTAGTDPVSAMAAGNSWLREWISIPGVCLGFAVGLLGALILLWWRQIQLLFSY